MEADGIELGVDLTVDVRDAVGDRLHISDEFQKDGVSCVSLCCGTGAVGVYGC